MAFGNKEKQRHSTSGTPWVLCLTVSQGKSSRFSALLLMLSSLSYWLSSSSFLFPIWLEIPALAFVPRFPDFTSDTAGGSCGSPLVFCCCCLNQTTVFILWSLLVQFFSQPPDSTWRAWWFLAEDGLGWIWVPEPDWVGIKQVWLKLGPVGIGYC